MKYYSNVLSVIGVVVIQFFLHLPIHTTSKIITVNGKVNHGKIRYHFDDNVLNSCESINIIGVGTGMSVDNYDILSSKISLGTSIVTIVVDPVPHNPMKMDKVQYANVYNGLTETDTIGDVISVCMGKKPMIIVGGHSASGATFIRAISNMIRQPKAYIGLDPFDSLHKLYFDKSLYTLNWGFSKTTCGVDVKKAAKAIFDMSSLEHRVFYRVKNNNNEAKNDINHCVFTDKGSCFGVICPVGHGGEWVLDAVATSIHTFVKAISTDSFQNKSQFVIQDINENMYDLFVNDDLL